MRRRPGRLRRFEPDAVRGVERDLRGEGRRGRCHLRRRPRYASTIVRKVLFAALLAGIVSASDLGHAAGFASARFGGEHGNVTAVNPTALYFNPGAIGLSEGAHLFLDGTLALRRVTWEHPPAANDVADPA